MRNSYQERIEALTDELINQIHSLSEDDKEYEEGITSAILQLGGAEMYVDDADDELGQGEDDLEDFLGLFGEDDDDDDAEEDIFIVLGFDDDMDEGEDDEDFRNATDGRHI